MRVAVLKVPGAESVDVSLERAVVEIRLRAGNAVTLAQLREIVKNNGFSAKEATVTVVGHLVERGGKPALNVTGANTVMLLRPDPKQPNAYQEIQARQQRASAATVELTGLVEARPEEPDTLIVRGVN